MSQTERIVDSLHKYVNLTHSMLNNNFTGLIPNPNEGYPFDESLSCVARAHEHVMSIEWLYETHRRENGDVIKEVIDLMFEGAIKGGRDWNEYFSKEKFPKDGLPSYAGPDEGFSRGVNGFHAGLVWGGLREGLREDAILIREGLASGCSVTVTVPPTLLGLSLG